MEKPLILTTVNSKSVSKLITMMLDIKAAINKPIKANVKPKAIVLLRNFGSFCFSFLSMNLETKIALAITTIALIIIGI